MTEKELIDLGKNKVRNNKQLLALFKGFFRESFGRDAICPDCTGFKDFDLLREKYYPTKSRTAMRLTKYKVLYPREKILAYLKNGRVYRSRVSTLTDEFLSEFLKYASPKVYPNYDKMIIQVIEDEPEVTEMPAIEKAPKMKAKPRQKKRRSPKKKKDE